MARIGKCWNTLMKRDRWPTQKQQSWCLKQKTVVRLLFSAHFAVASPPSNTVFCVFVLAFKDIEILILCASLPVNRQASHSFFKFIDSESMLCYILQRYFSALKHKWLWVIKLAYVFLAMMQVSHRSLIRKKTVVHQYSLSGIHNVWLRLNALNNFNKTPGEACRF